MSIFDAYENTLNYEMNRTLEYWLDLSTLEEEFQDQQLQVKIFFIWEGHTHFKKITNSSITNKDSWVSTQLSTLSFNSNILLISGRLCTWTHPDTADRRLDYSFETFERFRNSLRLECAKEGTAAVLTVTPNITWPDVVYYNSYTHPYMGWRINIVDDFNQRFNYGNGGVKMTATGGLFLIITNLVLVYISYL